MRIVVSDDGVGMQDADSGMAFELRSRADTKIQDEYDGGHEGLGLAIVKSIVMLHGSDVELKTCPGRGASFSLTLPIAHP